MTDISALEAGSLAEALEDNIPKLFFRGTHRTIAPAETVERVHPLARAMGITRISNVTALDDIGIPVAMAVRPNSRSISVCQGKGLTLEHAFASALMEAAEQFHGEDIAHRFRLASYRELSAEVPVGDPWALAGNGKVFDPDRRIHWIEGYDLLQREPCWVPAEIVHTDFTMDPRPDSGVFLRGTNGLASGNHLLEAISAGICEVVERDAVAKWTALPLRERASRWLELESVDDEDCRWLLNMFAAANMGMRVWDVTSDIGIATLVCDIREMSDDPRTGTRRFRGAGCHPDRSVALSRALTEAAQTRLTYIVGSRDDLPSSSYETSETAAFSEMVLDALQQQTAPNAFDQLPSLITRNLAAEVAWELERLRDTGFDRVISLDLTRAELGLPVARVVVPQLEGDCRNPEYRPGPRASDRNQLSLVTNINRP